MHMILILVTTIEVYYNVGYLEVKNSLITQNHSSVFRDYKINAKLRCKYLAINTSIFRFMGFYSICVFD